MVEFPSFFSMYIIKNFSVFRDCRRPTRWFVLTPTFWYITVKFRCELEWLSLETAFSMFWMQSRVGKRRSVRINFCSFHLVFLLFKNDSHVFVFLSSIFAQPVIFSILYPFPLLKFQINMGFKDPCNVVDIGYYRSLHTIKYELIEHHTYVSLRSWVTQ